MCVPCHQGVGPPTCALRFKLKPKMVFYLTRWNVIPILLTTSYPNNRLSRHIKIPIITLQEKKKTAFRIFTYTYL